MVKIKVQEMSLVAINSAFQAMQREIEQLKAQVKVLQEKVDTQTNIQEE